MDFRYSKVEPCVDDALGDAFTIHVTDGNSEIDSDIELLNPQIIVFDFDLPDQVGLDTLQKIKNRFPLLSMLIISDDHSIDLAIWALRLRLCDYFLKPVSSHEITDSFEKILTMTVDDKKTMDSCCVNQPNVPSDDRPYKTKANGLSTVYAVEYVKQNLADKIAVEKVATKCGMSRSHFSRTFIISIQLQNQQI